MEDKVPVSGPEEAAAYAESFAEEKYGEGFETLRVDEQGSEPDVTYMVTMVPDADPSKPFRSYVETSSGEARRPYDDYLQYLFKERAEGPFLEVLARDELLAGYAAVLYGRADRIMWEEGDYERYMGSGGFLSPYVRVFVAYPAGAGARECAEDLARLMEELRACGTSFEIIVFDEGRNPIKESLYRDSFGPDGGSGALITNDPSAGSVPSVERLERSIEGRRSFQAMREDPPAPWDGDGHPDGLAQDPTGYASYPTIIWNDGHGDAR